jgi:hypothetical protein
MTPPRNRLVYAMALIAIVAAGLASRRLGHALPLFVATYAGDTLWAAMVFVALAFLFPRAPTRMLALSALAFAYADEISQLYHAPWIDAIRRTTPGALVLGWGFLWSDVACYAAGVALAAGVDALTYGTCSKTSR